MKPRPPNPFQPKYVADDVHPTARCLECQGRLTFAMHGRSPYWTCEYYPHKCRFTTPALSISFEPDMAPRISVADVTRLKAEHFAITRDELASRSDVTSAIYKAIGRSCRLKHLRPEELPVAFAAVAQLRADLLAARPVEKRAVRETCCEVTKDDYGSMTICYTRRRWCLGRAEHAVRPGQTEELRGETWGEITWDDAEGWEDELREEAQSAFQAADSRRK